MIDEDLDEFPHYCCIVQLRVCLLLATTVWCHLLSVPPGRKLHVSLYMESHKYSTFRALKLMLDISIKHRQQ